MPSPALYTEVTLSYFYHLATKVVGYLGAPHVFGLTFRINNICSVDLLFLRCPFVFCLDLDCSLRH